MANKSKVQSVSQIVPTRRLMKPICYPSIENNENNERVYRPAKSISKLIKQGLVNGITKDIASTNGKSFDKSEGCCPKGLRLDVDIFDLASTMLNHGSNTKTLTEELNK